MAANGTTPFGYASCEREPDDREDGDRVKPGLQAYLFVSKIQEVFAVKLDKALLENVVPEIKRKFRIMGQAHQSCRT